MRKLVCATGCGVMGKAVAGFKICSWFRAQRPGNKNELNGQLQYSVL